MIALNKDGLENLNFHIQMEKLLKANFGYNVQTFKKFGIDFTNMIMKNSSNRFWKDVFQC